MTTMIAPRRRRRNQTVPAPATDVAPPDPDAILRQLSGAIFAATEVTDDERIKSLADHAMKLITADKNIIKALLIELSNMSQAEQANVYTRIVPQPKPVPRAPKISKAEALAQARELIAQMEKVDERPTEPASAVDPITGEPKPA